MSNLTRTTNEEIKMALRFLMVKNEKLLCGAERKTYYTIDADLETLETALTYGGYNEDQYELHELIGVEVIK
jgi:hypothetical protein